MIDRSKRLFVLIGFIGFLGLIALVIYLVFFRSTPVSTTPPSVETNSQPGTSSGLPGSGPGTTPTGTTGGTTPPTTSPTADGGATTTVRLTASSITSPNLASDGRSIVYYDAADGRFYKIGADGKVTRLSDQQFPDATAVTWNTTSDQVAIEFPDGTNVLFDFTTEKQTTLPAHWSDFAFSPSGSQVIAKSLGNNAAARSLVITNTDGSNTQIIQALGDNADLVDVAWSPNDQVVAFADTGASAVSGGIGRKMIYPIGKNNENFKGLVVEGLNFHAIWSPDGTKILYDVSGEGSDYRPLLWIVDGTSQTMGDHRTSLGLNTWVDKCVFADNDTVYCAVPATLGTGAGLQPDTNTSDDLIYRITLSSGKTKLIGYPSPLTQMDNLTVSTDGAYLYYTDSAGRLQYLRLK